MRLTEIRTLLDTAVIHAESLGVAVVVAVLDGAGHLVGKLSMDDTLLVCIELAEDKAYTAVALGRPSSELTDGIQPGGPLYGLNTALAGRFVPFGGGVPIRDADDRVVGGIGVSGATSEQDEEIATTAIAALASRSA